MSSLNLANTYNPDVLNCLANLSSDEVFTPPEIANQMLDLLPEELWHDPNATFLDPATKTGVFLREIAKRLLVGLEDQIPNLQERIDHIFHKQLFGIAITELTSLMARRSLYCSKYPNGRYSVSAFPDASGNIYFRETQHRWVNGRCAFCGASQAVYDRGPGLETHAYAFIHTTRPEEIFKMKFDVIIGNPPYHISVNEGGKGLGAIPIYHKFVQQAIKLRPRYLTMIIPSRWFSGGVGLSSFRNYMLNDRHIRYINDFVNSNDCFPGVDINGGVCYFLWDRDYKGDCEFYLHRNYSTTRSIRKLNEFDIFVRFDEALSIIHKVLNQHPQFLSEIVSSQTPFAFNSDVRGEKTSFPNSIKIFSSKGVGFVSRDEIKRNSDWIDKFKVMLPKITTEHGGIPDKEGKYKVLTSLRILHPGEICTQSYLIVGPFEDETFSENAKAYLETRFVRFLLQQSLTSMNISKDKFCFVPMQDFSKLWTDEELYAKYGLTDEEIAFIESMIRPMEIEEGEKHE